MISQAELDNREEMKPQSKTNVSSSCHEHVEKEQASQQRERRKQTPLGKTEGTGQEREQFAFLMISQDLPHPWEDQPVLGFHKIGHKLPIKSITEIFFFLNYFNLDSVISNQNASKTVSQRVQRLK